MLVNMKLFQIIRNIGMEGDNLQMFERNEARKPVAARGKSGTAD